LWQTLDVARYSEYRAEQIVSVKADLDGMLRLAQQAFDSSVQRAIELIILINGGASIAMLSFIGVSETLQRSGVAQLVLGIFVFGLVLACFVVAGSYEQARDTMEGFVEDYNKFFSDEIDLDNVVANLGAWRKFHFWLRVIGYASFACFLIGVLVAGEGIVIPLIRGEL
jgi:hypothetical protein